MQRIQRQHSPFRIFGRTFPYLPPPPILPGSNLLKQPPQHTGIFSTKPTPTAATRQLYCAVG
ncbi:MAG: hypothetical protein K8L97_20760 [Anaerolineae bacterium]|nr:hypothetical protein [Anaerolineae bacterium]